MEYKPSLPRHNDNVSHDKPVREFLLLFSGITGFLLSAFWALGLFVDFAVDYITPDMEAVIFSPMAGSLSKQPIADDQRQAELQRLIDALRKCIDINYSLKVVLVKSEDANAFAFPGGRIVVLSSLIDKVNSENGLSFVLAHELAHFKNRDHLRGLGRGVVLSALMAALTGAGSDLTQMFAPAAALGQAQYSQARESIADQQAMQILNCYYGHVGGATEFFEAMQPDGRETTKLIGQYFTSHPEAVKRIDNLHRLTRDLRYNVSEVLPLSVVLAPQDL